MKKILHLLTLLSFLSGAAQCPSEDIILTSQADIDGFAANYPGCTNLAQMLIVDGVGNAITNLNGLSQLVSGQEILITNTQIGDLFGLDNLISVAAISIWGNPNLTDFTGLVSLETAGRFESFFNNNVTDLTGIENLTDIQSVNLFENDNLSDISKLTFITELESLTLGGNLINSLNGLENLTTINGDFLLSNERITHVDELSNLTTISGALYVSDNTLLENLDGFINIESLDELYITDNSSLSNLNGMASLQTIDRSLRIGLNGDFQNLAAFSNLTVVTDLEIYENPSLESLTGLESLEVISGIFQLLNNPVLTDIEGINNVSTTEVQSVAIANNGLLATCSVDFVCGVIENVLVAKTILNNSPGCNGLQEIQNECLLGTNDSFLEEAIVLFPNPVSEVLQIDASSGIEIKNVMLYSMLGQSVMERASDTLDLSVLASGMYFVTISTSEGTVTKKIVKE